MWIFTSAGFVSAVESPTDEDMLQVRARDRESLRHMIEGIRLAGKADGEDYDADNMKILTKEFSDYPWRVFVSKSTFAIWLQFETLNYLNYKNYKNALTEVRGKQWHDAALNVWVDMLAVEEKDEQADSRPYSALSDQELQQLLIQHNIIDDADGVTEGEKEELHASLVEMNQPKKKEGQDVF